jgi:L-threonylcarbamoyladenylate synthase
MTKIIDSEDLSLAKSELDKGNIVIFPTETVYGIGANALDEKAVDKIFKAKGRPSNNPLIVHLKNKEEISKYAIINNEIEQKLVDTFMPGPFTLILQKKEIVPNNVTCNLNTVGIRIPIDPVAHHLLDLLDYPIAAPSANVSGKPSGTRINDIYDEFNEKVSLIIDGGESRIGLESTVCKVIDNVPTILRPGFITKEDIEMIIGKCNVSEYILKEAHGNVESPGMLYRHYAPNTKCILCDEEKIDEVACKYTNPIIIGNKKIRDYKLLNYGNNLVDIAHNIFKLLRKADKQNADVIIIQSVEMQGLGLAIMNRLIRTCEYNYIKRENENNQI